MKIAWYKWGINTYTSNPWAHSHICYLSNADLFCSRLPLDPANFDFTTWLADLTSLAAGNTGLERFWSFMLTHLFNISSTCTRLLNTVQIYISYKLGRSSSAPVQVTTFRSQWQSRFPHYLWFWVEYINAIKHHISSAFSKPDGSLPVPRGPDGRSYLLFHQYFCL